MKRMLLPVALLLALILVACGGAEPTTVTQERPVTVVVTSESGQEVVVTQIIQEVVTATPEPPPPLDKTMVICMSQEPNTLIWSESALVTSHVLQAVQPPLNDSRGYDYQATLVEELPSFDNGLATFEEVTVGEGDRIYDVSSDAVLTLTAGMTESFALNQLEGDPLPVEGYNGEELTTVQVSAQWTLLEGLTWEDGEPVTADDAVFGWELTSQAEWPSSKFTIERSEGYVAVDERTMRWTGLPGYTDTTYFLNWAQPTPRHLFDGMNAAEIQEDEGANRQPLSYGPYKIDEWVAGDSITLSPNPHWAGGEVPLETLIYRFIGDANQLVAQLVSGECDVGTQDAAFESALPLIRGFEEQALLELIDVAGTSFEHLDFNLQPVEGYSGAAATLTDSNGGALFQNVDFRHAIAYCLDRQAIVDQATNGAGFVQHTYTSADHPLYPGDEGITVYEFDPEQGKALLAGLGWTDSDGDGLLDKDGQTLSFVHSTRQNPLRESVTQIVQAQLLENCGIETEIELVGSEYFADGPDGIVFGRKYDLGEFAWNTGVQPPCNLYLSAQLPNEVNGWGSSNNTGFSNADFDSACNAALQALDDETEATQHAAAMAIFTDELPSLPLFSRAKIVVVRPGIVGVEVDPTNNSEMWNVENFDITQ